jgi:SAM-dependent methyltransferase
VDVRAYNRRAWDQQVAKANRWTVPVGPELVERARRGDWQVVLTPLAPVPRDWFPPLEGLRVLALAAGGGQQGPILAAAGARVTVLDNSPAQLDRDRQVARRDGLALDCVEGDMRALGFADGAFDLVFHPVANCFVEEVRPVWREAHRVLRPGGVMLAGFCNPVLYLFDYRASQRGELVVRHRLPYSDLTSIGAEERQQLIDDGDPLSFGHSLGDQIGGQLAAGFVLTGFYEDYWNECEPIAMYMPTFVATRAVKPRPTGA